VKNIVWQPKAKRQLKKIKDVSIRASIVDGVGALEAFPAVEGVKPLVNHACSHRLRIGGYRVLFRALEEIAVISIEEVKKRDERTYR